MTDHEQQRRRGEFLQRSKDAQEIWDREIACPSGPLPGAVLDVLEHDDGRVGHVQLMPGRPASDINKAVAAIEETWDLLPGSVVVDSGGSGAELWVYRRPSAARHHRLRPMSIGSRRGQRDAGGLFDGEASHLQDWANRYAHSWKAMRGGGPVDMERFLRRLARLEAGLTDCTYYAGPGVPGQG
ncbi:MULTISPECIES: hypothetical protein [unclassified Streptomyces]|uniref:Uncharacterized protein n=1 Tax=Streptomyces sp. NBC_00119 TaxID=2975659 RepID=A0AAU1UM65_9ACTN|nr:MULTISPECIES: hypothetical protein [unclassified Streptomyces]MCX4649226.1 hypothetical protein [Streptomyces sp. NBC_01446]MCX5321565.1 hypothetical protein [Streptomyces sp. NBC_00120]